MLNHAVLKACVGSEWTLLHAEIVLDQGEIVLFSAHKKSPVEKTGSHI